MNMDASLLLHIEIEILLQEYLLYNDAWIHVGLLYSKNEIILLAKQVCLIIINRNTTDILDMSCCHKHQRQTKS